MEERHTNRDLYFNEQTQTCEKYILPYIDKYKKLDKTTRILEIGCGYGGNLLPFIELGCQVTGIDIRESSIETAKMYLNFEGRSNLTLIASDIYDVTDLDGYFDIIFMKDTIEHIPNQEKFVPILNKFLKQDGIVFQGFPPWCNPFGGHQQMCKSKFLSKLPWFHLLPRPLFKGVLKLFGEKPDFIEHFLADVYDTRISIQRFMRIFKKNGFVVLNSDFYFINPNYEIKFKLKPRRVLSIFNIPYLRDFYTTTVYCVLQKK